MTSGLLQNSCADPRAEMRRRRALAKSGSAPSLSTAGREVLGASSAELPSIGEITAAPAQPDHSQFINDRHRLMARKHLPPKDRYSKPQTSNHQVGWRPNLERFGVNHHGKSKLGEIMPIDAG